jgi:uncharacterized protein (DUF885 family)
MKGQSSRMQAPRHGVLRRLAVFQVILGLAACSLEPSGGEPQEFPALLDEIWEFEVREDPLFATTTGDARYDARLPAVTLEDENRRAAARREFLGRLEAIDAATLAEQDRITWGVQARQLRERIDEHELGGTLLPFRSDDGFHIAFARLPGGMPFRTTQEYENYIARLNAYPAWVDQWIGVLREGLRVGATTPRVVLEGYDLTMSSHIVDDVETSLFWPPFANMPATMPDAEQTRLREAGRAAIGSGVVAGYRKLLDFFNAEYMPGARTSIGASELPDGRTFYDHRIRSFTTLDMSAEEIHQKGVEEVARIRTEMEAIIQKVGFRGDFAAFLRFLRTDPRFYARTPAELLREASFIAKRMDAQLPALFGRLPRQPYGVAPVPDHLAPKYTGGRYVGAPPGSTQPGYYWVNTYALENRPLYVLESLTLHEAVPGHHLQKSLAAELEGLPPVRRFTYHSAFGEGWGLYSEWLGIEAGFYTDPYHDFGRLTYEMWRACRLVVDTGMHAFGWTREQAMDYIAGNTALSLHEVRTEIDRYIAWPGQALAYKLGEIKIKELRTRAAQALGERFDVRAFHDVVLRNGSVPLDVLEDQIDGWIAEQRATS